MRSDPPGGGSQKQSEDQPSSMGAGSLMGVGVQAVTEQSIFPGRMPTFLLERLQRLRQPCPRPRRPRIGLPLAVSAARGPRRGQARSGRGGGDSMRRSVPSRSRAAVGRGRARRLAPRGGVGSASPPSTPLGCRSLATGPSEGMTLSPSCVILTVLRHPHSRGEDARRGLRRGRVLRPNVPAARSAGAALGSAKIVFTVKGLWWRVPPSVRSGTSRSHARGLWQRVPHSVRRGRVLRLTRLTRGAGSSSALPFRDSTDYFRLCIARSVDSRSLLNLRINK